jgi:acetyltransferase
VNFKALFQPKTVAIIGVSLQNDRHPANVIFNKNNLRFQAEVFPINERGGILQGATVYTRISDVPSEVDLAVIAVRAEMVPAVMAECIEAGVGGAVVISGGFAETGQGDLQDRVVSLARG